jgi:hypothetical protein
MKDMENQNQEQPIQDESDVPPPPHNRRPLLISSLLALTLLVVLGGIFIYRVLGIPIAPASLTTPTSATGNVYLYFQTMPESGSISINGHSLAHPPLYHATNKIARLPPPLRLSNGVYKVSWSDPPFPSQSCTLAVPIQFNVQSCLRNNASAISSTSSSATQVWIITFSNLLTDLPLNQRSALVQAMQARLNTMQSTETVLPGEVFVELASHHVLSQLPSCLRPASISS